MSANQICGFLKAHLIRGFSKVFGRPLIGRHGSCFAFALAIFPHVSGHAVIGGAIVDLPAQHRPADSRSFAEGLQDQD